MSACKNSKAPALANTLPRFSKQLNIEKPCYLVMWSHNLGLTHHYSEDNPRQEWERKSVSAGGTVIERERETSTVPMTSARMARKSDAVSHLDQPRCLKAEISITQNEFKTVQKTDQCKRTRFNHLKSWKMWVTGLKGGDHKRKREERRMCI